MSSEVNISVISQEAPHQPANPAGKMGNKLIEWVTAHPVATIAIVALVAAALFASAPYLTVLAFALVPGVPIILPSLGLVGVFGGAGAIAGATTGSVIVGTRSLGQELPKPDSVKEEEQKVRVSEGRFSCRKENLPFVKRAPDFTIEKENSEEIVLSEQEFEILINVFQECLERQKKVFGLELEFEKDKSKKDEYELALQEYNEWFVEIKKQHPLVGFFKDQADYVSQKRDANEYALNPGRKAGDPTTRSFELVLEKLKQWRADTEGNFARLQFCPDRKESEKVPVHNSLGVQLDDLHYRKLVIENKNSENALYRS